MFGAGLQCSFCSLLNHLAFLSRHRCLWKTSMLRRGRIDGGPTAPLQWSSVGPQGRNLHQTYNQVLQGAPRVWDQQDGPRDRISRTWLLVPHTPTFGQTLGLAGAPPVHHGPQPQQPASRAPGLCHHHHASWGPDSHRLGLAGTPQSGSTLWFAHRLSPFGSKHSGMSPQK